MKSKPTSPALTSQPSDQADSNTVDSPSLDDAMRIDQFRLRRARKRLSEDEYQRRLALSVAQLESRKAATPRIEYPDELPISGYREQLIQLLKEHQVIVVCGETGSGKSTQLPKICLDAGLGRRAMIGHTQPRRLAARSIASRLAEELDCPLGTSVGYQVRFGDHTSPETLVKLMTDGILLAETGSDRFLDAYDVIIIDEAHERSLNIDFLLGYLRRLQSKRRDLKIMITSATIDAERFAEHFGDDSGPAPIVQVEGRSYPVEIQYLPWDEVVDEETRGYDLARHVIAGIDRVSRLGGGDSLVFLPTERDIREISHRVVGHFKRLGIQNRVDVLPLYARLPTAEQQRVFSTGSGKRRIVFATNVAESSLTVPGIRYVIDSGTARISRFSPRSKMQRLPIEPVSRASADQRAGRCGRVGPGVCLRLYSLDEYEARDSYTTPEIRRTNLASVVLQTKVLRLGRLEDFPLLDSPRPETIREGIRTLVELGALDDRGELTEVGQRLGRLPVDPRVGRILLAAHEGGCLAEVLPIAAALEIPDPRDRPPDKRQAADEAHQAFADPRSDFLSLLRLWRYYGDAKSNCSRNQLTRNLRKRFLSPTRMREWADVYRQLREMAGSLGGKKTKVSVGSIRYSDGDQIVDDDRYAAIHQALLAGLLSGVAMAGDKNEYTGAGGLKLFLWPGSGLFQLKPKWMVAAELVETTKQYARTVAQIQPQWIESVGSHLLKSSHSDPHWSSKAGGAFCYLRQSLFGLPVVVRRRVPLPPIDPITARDLLINHGLAEDQLRTTAKFVQHNRRLVEAIASLAAKTRRRDMVIDSYMLARFYQQHLPAEVSDRGRLEKWDRSLPVPDWSKQLRDAAALSQWLADPPSVESQSTPYLKPEDLLEIGVDAIRQEDFPDELTVGKSKLPLEYRFQPGSTQDGVELKIHQAALSQISDDRLGWLVPGLLHSKIVSMIKSLPKRIRRNLVPAADVAEKIVAELESLHGQQPFLATVCQVLSRHAEMPIGPEDFRSDKMDPHLEFLVTVVDDQGQQVAQGRQVAPLLKVAATTAPQSDASSDADPADDWMRESMTTFEIERLPQEVVRNRGGVQIAQYPGLVDQGDAVSTSLFADSLAAERSTRIAVTRLFAMTQRKELRSQVRWLPALDEAKIKLSDRIAASDLEQALIDLLARIAFVESQPMIRTQAEFESRCQQRAERVPPAAQQIAPWLAGFVEHYFAVRRELESMAGSRFATATEDVRAQVGELLRTGFLSTAPWQWLQHYPRYFQAIAYRLDKLRSGSAARDQELQATVQALHDRWWANHPELADPLSDPMSHEFRWMLEELRVSLFAQPLGTAVKVSPQRCEKLLQ